MKSLDDFTKNKNYLLCVDSDGCVMDTMNCKHILCFGPCFADEWSAEGGREKVLERWNQINLYEMTRGINRFKGYAMQLSEMYPEDADVKEFLTWTQNAPELSEKAVEAQIASGAGSVFQKALSWSKEVNRQINLIPDEKKVPFSGAKEAIAKASKTFNTAIVSSANFAAVTAEWERCGILQYMDAVGTQTDGSKACCISKLLGKGYSPENCIMCGDAEGDLKAAEACGVWFYPILVNHEKESWDGLESFANSVASGDAAQAQERLKAQFYANLSN